MTSPMILGELFGISWLYWYQPLLLIALVALLIGYKKYRDKQM